MFDIFIEWNAADWGHTDRDVKLLFEYDGGNTVSDAADFVTGAEGAGYLALAEVSGPGGSSGLVGAVPEPGSIALVMLSVAAGMNRIR